MPKFMLLMRFTPADEVDLAPEEMQRIIERYRAWSQELIAQGHLLGGDKLCNEGGRHLRVHNDKIMATDGPYSEAKEVVGGFFMIEADDYGAAEAIAQTCPHLRGRQWIEVRQVDGM